MVIMASGIARGHVCTMVMMMELRNMAAMFCAAISNRVIALNVMVRLASVHSSDTFYLVVPKHFVIPVTFPTEIPPPFISPPKTP